MQVSLEAGRSQFAADLGEDPGLSLGVALAGESRPLALLIHQPLEAFLIDAHALVGGYLLSHLQGETEGVVEGRISFAAAGDFGFGYDPIFVPIGYNKSFGELGAEVKHRISHRAQALRLFRERLARLLASR